MYTLAPSCGQVTMFQSLKRRERGRGSDEQKVYMDNTRRRQSTERSHLNTYIDAQGNDREKQLGGQERELKRHKNRKNRDGNWDTETEKQRWEDRTEWERETDREREREEVRWRGKGLMGLGDEVQRSLSHLTSKRSNSWRLAFLLLMTLPTWPVTQRYFCDKINSILCKVMKTLFFFFYGTRCSKKSTVWQNPIYMKTWVKVRCTLQCRWRKLQIKQN